MLSRMDTWILILIGAIAILIGYILFYEIKSKKRLHHLSEKHEVHYKHERPINIIAYIERCWSEGYSIPEIEEILISKGWDISTIKEMFYKSRVPNSEEKISKIKNHMRKIVPRVKTKRVNTPRKEKAPIIQKKEVKSPEVKKETNKNGIEDLTEETEYHESQDVSELRRQLYEEFKEN